MLAAADALGITDPRDREVSVHDEGAAETLVQAAESGGILTLTDVEFAQVDGFLRGVEFGKATR